MGRAEDIFSQIVDKGEGAIDSFIETQESEHLSLDFKRSADDGNGVNLHAKDRKNLSKAISGFGNSGGGVIVWGVDCSGDSSGADVARQKCPLVDAKKFKSLLEGAISGCTIPSHPGVQNEAIFCKDNNSGFVVTLIPMSNRAPHQAVMGKKYYYIRAGSDFDPTPHSVLAGMFGRRPQPHVLVKLTAKSMVRGSEDGIMKAEIQIENDGPTIAKDLFVSAKITSIPHPDCRIAFAAIPWDPSPWDVQVGSLNHISIISQDGVRLAPEASLSAGQWLEMTFPISILSKGFIKELKIEMVCGCGEAPPQRIVIQKGATELGGALRDFMEDTSIGELRDEKGQKKLGAFLGIQYERRNG